MARTRETLHLNHPRGGCLVGDFSGEANSPPHVVLFLHGLGSLRNGEKAASLEQACARRGWAFAAFDLRGHGESTGTMFDLCCSNILEDLEAIRQALARRGFSRLCPVGSSMGGWATLWWTLTNPTAIPGAVLLAPALHFPLGLWKRLSPQDQEAWQRTGRLRLVNDWMDAELGYQLIEDAKNFPLEKLVTSWNKPTLIFHGMQDDVVPYQNTLDFAQRLPSCPLEIHLFATGDHRLVAYKNEMAEQACEFFKRVLEKPP
jgi:alpha-beta hydrolase superfamily lysophospholipase